jgi:hypothetical protein
VIEEPKMEVQGYPVFQILIADIDRDSIIANIAIPL